MSLRCSLRRPRWRRCRRLPANSGGQYFEVTKAMVDATTGRRSGAGRSCAPSTLAVQHAFVPSTTFNTAPTPALPFGPYSEYPGDQPDRRHGQSARREQADTDGGTEALPDSETYIFNGECRDSTAFERAGHDVGSGCRASKPSCARSASTSRSPIHQTVRLQVRPGRRRGLWVSSAPAAGSRNIYTVLPGSTDDGARLRGATSSELDDYLKRQRSRNADRLGAQRADGRGRRLDAGVSRSAVARSAARSPITRVPRGQQGPPRADLRRRQRRHAARDRCAHRRRSVGVHSVQPAAQAEGAALRPVDRRVQVLRRQLAEDLRRRRSATSGAHICSSARAPAGRSTTRSTSRSTTSTIRSPRFDEHQRRCWPTFVSQTAINWKWSFPRNTSFDATHVAVRRRRRARGHGERSEQTVGETWSDPAIGQVQTRTART